MQTNLLIECFCEVIMRLFATEKRIGMIMSNIEMVMKAMRCSGTKRHQKPLKTNKMYLEQKHFSASSTLHLNYPYHT